MEIDVKDTRTKGTEVDWKNLFLYNEKLYNYYIAQYNNTHRNERKIEIPIIVDYIRKYPTESILEVGNVVSHYFANVTHDIVDLNEEAPNVLNEDIVKYAPNKKYDLIITISTLEHVGFEGTTGVYFLIRGYLEKAFANLRNLLSDGGRLIFTVPLGYNPELDNLVLTEKLGIDEIYCMENNLIDDTWKQVSFKDIKGKPVNNFIKNLINTEDKITILRKTRYLIIGVINGSKRS